MGLRHKMFHFDCSNLTGPSKCIHLSSKCLLYRNNNTGVYIAHSVCTQFGNNQNMSHVFELGVWWRWFKKWGFPCCCTRTSAIWTKCSTLITDYLQYVNIANCNVLWLHLDECTCPHLQPAAPVCLSDCARGKCVGEYGLFKRTKY